MYQANRSWPVTSGRRRFAELKYPIEWVDFWYLRPLGSLDLRNKQQKMRHHQPQHTQLVTHKASIPAGAPLPSTPVSLSLNTKNRNTWKYRYLELNMLETGSWIPYVQLLPPGKEGPPVGPLGPAQPTVRAPEGDVRKPPSLKHKPQVLIVRIRTLFARSSPCR